MSKSWYLSTSDNYLSGFENEEFTLNAPTAFDEILLNSPETYSILINGLTDIGIVQDKDAREVKQLLTRLNTINRGDLVTYKENNYLVTDFVDDNKMHQSAEIQVCNTEIEIKLKSSEKVLIGYDPKGRPVHDYVDLPPLILPAIVEKTTVVESLNDAINIDEDKVKITISYRNLDTVEYFFVYNEKYKIVSRDKTKSIKDAGLLILIGERSTD